MKLTLTYEFTEEEIYQKRPEEILSGYRYDLVITELDNKLRSMSKYENKEKIDIDEVRSMILDSLVANDLTPR